jgi:hypothetical protein
MSRRGGFDQRLPLPVGGRSPIRRYRRFWFAAGRDRLRLVVLTVGVIAAVLGGVFGTRQPTVAVEMTGQYYEIGSISLTTRGDGVYAGADGAVVIEQGRGETVAGGSTTLHGVPMKGSCTMPSSGDGEKCRFDLGGRSLRATDTRTATGWHRRYQDGRTVDIALPGDAVPVPFAIGR